VIISAWVMLIFFGFISINGMLKFLISSLNWFHAILWFVSIVITALSAGVIWGGLFQ
jgi:hypothetical protein